MKTRGKAALSELQFLVGLPPVRMLDLARRHRIDASLSVLRRVAQIVFVGALACLAHRPAAAQITPARQLRPVFIVGHWRSGTSVLQRLLACDPRFRTPTYLECAFPHVTVGFRPWFLKRLSEKLPATRGFDAFPFGLDVEFEDEFALLKLTLESPLLAYLFPRDARSLWQQFFDSEPSEKWRSSFHAFVWRCAPDGGLILLKSPTHAFRIPALLDLFPDACFICIHRDPVEVFLSTRELDRHLLANNALHSNCLVPDEDLILYRQKEHMRAVECAGRVLSVERFAELTFEQLQARPLLQLKDLCTQLGLGEFAPERVRFERTVMEFRRHRRQWNASCDLRELVTRSLREQPSILAS